MEYSGYIQGKKLRPPEHTALLTTHCEGETGCCRTLLALVLLDARLVTSPVTVARLSAEVVCTTRPSLSSWEMVV